MQHWKRFDGSKISKPIEQHIMNVLVTEKAIGNSVEVCIGTDSQVKGPKIDFATVVVFKRKNKGAFMLIHKETIFRKMLIKERMLYEVSKSIDVAFRFSPLFINHNVKMEVHADINTNSNFKSNIALNEAMGYIMNMGFAFKAKPHAFASSSCANRMVQ